LSEVNNPLLRSVDTLQCVACHTATRLIELRRDGGSVAQAGRYQSGYNLSLDAGASPANTGSLRAFGWFGDQPMISQRVVNDTAQVLTELAQCQ
jgi:CTP:molybdopterin cytidylyltransferase MocA